MVKGGKHVGSAEEGSPMNVVKNSRTCANKIENALRRFAPQALGGPEV